MITSLSTVLQEHLEEASTRPGDGAVDHGLRRHGAARRARRRAGSTSTSTSITAVLLAGAVWALVLAVWSSPTRLRMEGGSRCLKRKRTAIAQCASARPTVVRTVDPDALDAIAPATPKWRVRDVLAHMVGVTDRRGRRPPRRRRDRPVDRGAGRRAARRVGRRHARRVGRVRPAVRNGARSVRPRRSASQAVFDAVTHEQDIRHALGAPGGRDCDAVGVAFDFYCQAARTGRSPDAAHRHRGR